MGSSKRPGGPEPGRKRIRRRLTLLAVGAAMTAGLLPGSANAFVYWAEPSQPPSASGTINGPYIYRANLDGSGSRPFISGVRRACGVAVDSQHIYWANSTGPSIGRSNLDGSGTNQDFISLPAGTDPCGVAVNGSQIWWVNSQLGPPGNAFIGRANLDGTGVVQSMFSSPQVDLPCGIAVDSSFVYWVNNFGTTPSIWRAGLNGTPAPSAIVGDAANRDACWPTIGGSRLYWWADNVGIVSADLDGSNPSVAVGAPAPGGIAILASELYWATDLPAMINRTTLGGGAPQFGFLAARQPTGLAVDSGAPSNRISFGGLRRNRVKGVASLKVKVRDPGKLSLDGPGVVKRKPHAPTTKAVYLPATLELRIKAKGPKAVELARRGELKLRVRVHFFPLGAAASSRTKTVRLIEN